VLGMIIWNITDYYGGMIIHLLQYWYIIIPILILYLWSLIKTIVHISKNGIKKNGIVVGIHLMFLVFFFSVKLIDSDIFKSNRVLTGTMKDDLAHYTLILRENGTCENNVSGLFGFEKKYNGKYIMSGDTIIFTKKPYDNNFIPDTVLLDRQQNAIFIYRNKEGVFSTEKQWLNHFELKKTTANNGYSK
tara:strand:+ start:80 stop:646 length:567 start_codon:yes stop_codon:yes gene_type:complete